MRKRTESLAYLALLGLLLLSMVGIPHLRYAFYTAPVATLSLWLLNKEQRITVSRPLLPFALLLLLGLLSLIDYDLNSAKKTFFIFVYVWTFALFDFSRITIDFRKLAVFFTFIFLARTLMVKGIAWHQFEFSVLDSRSSLESTLAFPLGLITLYLFLDKRYLWFGLMALLCLVALKRVVLLALLVSILINLVPQRFRRYLLNPVTISAALLGAVLLMIEFAHGRFDSVIMEYTGLAANHFSKGRQQLWATALTAASYTPSAFLFSGIGVGKVVTVLQKAYHADRILLHNDLLTIVLESGFAFFLLFIFLLNHHRSLARRTTALFLSILFLTDNVIIYQHVMFVYLLIQSVIDDDSASDGDNGKTLWSITGGPDPT